MDANAGEACDIPVRATPVWRMEESSRHNPYMADPVKLRFPKTVKIVLLLRCPRRVPISVLSLFISSSVHCPLANFTQFFLPVACGRVSVLLRRRFDTSCTSGFVVPSAVYRKYPKSGSRLAEFGPQYRIQRLACRAITASVEFLARDVIYTSRAYATMSVSVCLFVCLSVTEVHCGRGACR